MICDLCGGPIDDLHTWGVPHRDLVLNLCAGCNDAGYMRLMTRAYVEEPRRRDSPTVHGPSAGCHPASGDHSHG